MIDIYSIDDLEQQFDDTIMDVTSPLKIYYQQLSNLMSGETGAIFGAEEMPIDLEALVYEMNLNNKQIQKIIQEKINRGASMSQYFPTTVEVKFTEGTKRDMCIIDISIDGRTSLSMIIK